MLSKNLSRYIQKVKGHNYQIDDRIPASYLFLLIASRLIMKLRGFFSGVKKAGTPFIGNSVTIKVKSRIVIGRGVTINNGCYIDALSIEGIRFGNNVSVGPKTKIECTGNLQHIGKGLKVGNNVGLGADNFYGCAGGIVIGDDSIVGNFVSFHSENHVYTDLQKPIRLQGVSHQGIKIGNNCWIGAKATILDGVIIEDGCIIAAGSLVKSGLYKENGIYGGVPAKLIKYRSNYE
jgi:acetyltransferase-like isoleucine patch superfamily enzyme